MLTTESVWIALKQLNLRTEHPGRSLGRLVQLANRELREWGHDGHQVTVERITPYFGNPEVLRCSFWCETCHVSHHSLIAMPSGRATPSDDSNVGPADDESRLRPRWSLWPPSHDLVQRILG
ncbi:MAG: hypothetical protein OXI41_06965 [Chloroflexota bacterium]|nr:hypothetical protein [Chloroflexota bacterium]MDE2893861.1 hypothetical protein [Chloroflexota bacterium]